jgi:hypothetical protein
MILHLDNENYKVSQCGFVDIMLETASGKLDIGKILFSSYIFVRIFHIKLC